MPNNFEVVDLIKVRPNQYSKEPDGVDCFNKIFYCGKIGALIGGYMCLHHFALKKNPPRGYLNILTRVASISSRPVGAGVTFAAVTCISTDLRGKDDQINWGLGGASAGAVIGLMRNCNMTVFLAGIGGYVLGYILKDSSVTDWNLFGRRHYDLRQFDGNTLYIKKSGDKENIS